MPAICIPLAQGVPNLNGAPGFISDPPGAKFKDKLDDPRWTGALSQGFPVITATSDAAAFRAVYFVENGVKSVYLSWRVKADSVVNTGATGDVFYIGFRPNKAGTATVLKISPFGVATNLTNLAPEGAPANGSIDTFTNTGAGGVWVQAGSDPAWVNANTRVWLQVTPVEYAIQMRVPYNLFSLGDTFSMWYAMRTVLPTNPPVYYTWPSGPEPTTTINGEQFPDPNGWQEYGASPTCVVGAGVGFSDYDDIGTQKTPTHEIQKVGPNTFYARPINSTGVAIPAQTIKARFRIANWGSTYSDASWDDVPGLAAVTHLAAYPTGHPTPPATPLTGVWTLSPADLAKYTGSGKTQHQCIFVTLSGAGVTFTRDSAARNMDFVPASLIERVAEINLQGLAAISAQPRDVYILVKKGNMPKNALPNYSEGEFLSTTLNQMIEANRDNEQFVGRLNTLVKLLDGASGRADEQSAQQLGVLMQVLFALLAQLSQEGDGDNGLAASPSGELVAAIRAWLAAVKLDKAASRRLATFLQVLEDWLAASANGGINPKTQALSLAITTWLAQLPNDAASQRNLPTVVATFRRWLSGLPDESGAAARLGQVIGELEVWLKERGSLEALGKIIASLSVWLGGLGKDEGNMRAQLGWLIGSIREWLMPGKDHLDVLVAAMQAAKLTSSDYAKIFPTCIYHVFHDTGRRERLANGSMSPVLEAQAGFGIHAYHEGALAGWSAIIEGATRLAEDFYVLKVPENSTARVTTKIQAREPGEESIPEPPIEVPPGTTSNKGCWQAILDLLTGKK